MFAFSIMGAGPFKRHKISSNISFEGKSTRRISEKYIAGWARNQRKLARQDGDKADPYDILTQEKILFDRSSVTHVRSSFFPNWGRVPNIVLPRPIKLPDPKKISSRTILAHPRL